MSSFQMHIFLKDSKMTAQKKSKLIMSLYNNDNKDTVQQFTKMLVMVMKITYI